MTHLILTVRFLDNRYHGLLTKKGPPEWPPSPYRLFQALVAGVARRGELVVGEDVPSNKTFTPIGQALGWLQMYSRNNPPLIISPKHKVGQAITRFVPNNDDETHHHPELHRVAKPTIPLLFLLELGQKPEVHYAWPLKGERGCPWQDIDTAARSLTTLGWGIDMAFASARLLAEAELQTLKGIRWYPKNRDYPFDETLRVPTYDSETEECTLCDLRHCHSTFINRIEHGKPLRTVDKPKIFDRVLYTSTERPVGRPYAVFRIECDDETKRFSYAQSKLIHVAGMVKHLSVEAMRENPPLRDLRGIERSDWVRAFVAGHQSKEDKNAGAPHTQFSYIPLQSIGTDHTDPGVRRVMIVAPIGDDAWLEHLARYLEGIPLKPLPNTKLPSGTRLERIDNKKRDGVRDAYLTASNVWASVTPVILPGHDDHKPEKTRKLIEKALAQSGIDQPCEFEWRAFSRFRKMLSAHKYRRDPSDPSKKILINYVRPDHLLDQSAVHLTLRFGRREDPQNPESRWIPADHPVPGPLAIGAGRHCGFGIFAGINS